MRRRLKESPYKNPYNRGIQGVESIEELRVSR